MPKATVDIQPSDFRFGWGRNYMVLKLVLLPIHSFWRRKSYMVLKPGGWTTGLEEDKIAGFSNLLLRCKDKEIAGHSNIYWLIVTAAKGLAEDKIT